MSGTEDTLSTAWLLWGLLFSSIGLGFFVYGKKQRAVVPLVCGLVLLVFPYFVSSTVLVVAIGVVLVAIPYFIRL
jgi:predicted membrane protein